MGRQSKGKKKKTSKSSAKKKPEKPLKDKETSTSPVDQQKSQLPDKSLKGKEISTSPVKQKKRQLPEKKPLKGIEISTFPSVQKKRQLPEKQGKDQEISTSPVKQKYELVKKPLSGIKVLLVEDNEMLRNFATVQLCNNGAIVEVCEDGKEAFDRVCILLRDNDEEGYIPYNYILMDCEMPIMNGYESTKLLRQHETPYGIRLPIIGLTEIEMTEEAISKTKDAGMDSYLTKPLEIDSLQEAIANLPNAPHKKKNILTLKVCKTQETQKPQLQELCDKPPASPDPEKPLSGKKVLVVEDAPVLCNLVTGLLSRLGAIVDVCVNGKDAFYRVCEALRDQNDQGHDSEIPTPYHCILMDCEMPIMNGYEATKLIREEERRYGIQMTIIAVTENGMGEEASKAKDAGMDFHLSKPLEIDNLKNALTNLPVKE